MSSLVKIPELQRTMNEMSKEMMKTGIIEELIEDTMDNVFDSDDIENVADAEIDNIINEITKEKLSTLPDPSQSGLNPRQGATASADVEDDEDEDMAGRLEALKT